MVNFAIGLLLGYIMGMIVQHYVSKIDEDLKNGGE